MKSKSVNYYAGLFILFSALVFTSCSKEKVEKIETLEEVHAKEGIPVQVLELKKQSFTKSLTYFAKLSGIKEATKGAPIGGKIAKINAQVGQFVKEDAVIVEFPHDAPSMKLEQAMLALENSEKTFKRMKALLEAGETSQQQFDNIETKYLVDKRNIDAIKQALYIDAPFDGVITKINVTEGDNVKSETHLFSIAQLHKMKTKIWVSGKEIGKIKKGMKATAKWNDAVYPGVVTEVALAMDPMKQAFYAEIEFNNPNKELKSGLTVDIDLITFTNEEAFVIPRTYIQNSGETQFVYVNQNGVVATKEIKTGKVSGISVEVVEGLAEGDQVISCCFNQIENGKKIKVIK